MLQSQYITAWLSFSLGEGERHRSGRRSELRLRQQQRGVTPGAWRRDLHQAGRRQGARREQQQIQHVLRVHDLRRLTRDGACG